MALTMVNSVTIRMDRFRQFEEAVGQLARRAVEKKEAWTWTGHQALFGDTRTLHFVYQAPDFAALEKLGNVDELWRRVMGEKRGGELVQKANECVESGENTISTERPDLSYPPDATDGASYPLAVITTVRIRPGRAEACEELLRKVAEAIPKTGDPARMVSYQSTFGDLLGYWTVRPLRSLGELDRQLPTPELLNKAFGTAEGGLIWRSGTEAIEQVQRQIMAFREDLSNPS